MIAQLTGRVDALSDGTCVIDVGGVGYLVQASSRTLSALPQPPAVAKVLIETHVREDAIVLYGFRRCRRTRLVPPADHRAGRRRPGRPRHPVGAVAARPDRRHRRRRQGQPDPGAGRRPAPGDPTADRTEGQDRRHADLARASATLRSRPRRRPTMRSPLWSTSATAAPRRSRPSRACSNAWAKAPHSTR